jgi:hypothetical protein
MCVTVFFVKTVPLSAYLISNTKSPLAWITAVWYVFCNLSGGFFTQNLNFTVFKDKCLWFFCMPEKAVSGKKGLPNKTYNTLLQMAGYVV